MTERQFQLLAVISGSAFGTACMMYSQKTRKHLSHTPSLGKASRGWCGAHRQKSPISVQRLPAQDGWSSRAAVRAHVLALRNYPAVYAKVSRDKTAPASMARPCPDDNGVATVLVAAIMAHIRGSDGLSERSPNGRKQLALQCLHYHTRTLLGEHGMVQAHGQDLVGTDRGISAIASVDHVKEATPFFIPESRLKDQRAIDAKSNSVCDSRLRRPYRPVLP